MNIKIPPELSDLAEEIVRLEYPTYRKVDNYLFIQAIEQLKNRITVFLYGKVEAGLISILPERKETQCPEKK